MNAHAEKGIWTQELSSGEMMIVNENLNYIRVVNQRTGRGIKYECPDGVLISDIEQIKKAHESKGKYNRVMG
jgi:DNA topoisomerase IB